MTEHFDPPALQAESEGYCVIGGGATGCTFLIALAQKLGRTQTRPRPGTPLHLIDPQGFGNGGTAYGKTAPRYLLNSVRTEMSPWDPLAFHNYCVARGLGDDRLSIESRNTYRDFLHAETRTAIEKLGQAGFVIREHRDEVTLRRAGNSAINVTGAHTNLQIAPDRLLLAAGYGPKAGFENLENKKGFVISLYPPAQAQQEIAANPGAHIALIGSGAALFDALRLLPDNFTGNVSVFSPCGKLLDRRDLSRESEAEENRALPLPLFMARNAEDLQRSLRTIFEHAVTNQGFTQRRAALNILRAMPGLLATLPAEEARQFRRKHLSALFHTATPVPYESYGILRDLKNNNRFRLHRAKLSSSDITARKEGGFDIATPDGSCACDIVIDCTGHDALNLPVIDSLLRENLASKDDVFGTLRADATGYRLTQSGIACIGPATHKGLHGMESFYTYVDAFTDQVLAAPQQKIQAAPAYIPPAAM